MPRVPDTESSRMYDELTAVHDIMRRGVDLLVGAYQRLAAGEAVDTKVLAGTAKWLIEFVHHHHQSEDELFWPVLRRLFPEAVAGLDTLTAEHEALDAALDRFTVQVDGLLPAKGAAVAADVVTAGSNSVDLIRDVLFRHLDAEEPILQELFKDVPDEEIVRLRKAIVASAPRSGPHLVFGLMEDPGQVQGYASMTANFPGVLRLMRPVLLGRYRSTKKALKVA